MTTRILHFNTVNITGWRVQVSMNDRNGKICVFMYHPRTQILRMKYLGDEEQVRFFIASVLERFTDANNSTNI